MQVIPEGIRRTILTYQHYSLFLPLGGRSGQEEEGASGHAGVLLHSGRSWQEQGDLGVPEERWGLAPQHHTKVAVPRRPESYIGFRHFPPPR